MIARDFVPLRTIVIDRQSLMAKGLRSLLEQNASVNVVADNAVVDIAEIKRCRAEFIIYGYDNVSEDLGDTLSAVRAVVPNLLFCILSSYPNPELMQRCMALGADGFLLKDMSLADLDIALRVIASGSCYVDARVAGQMLARRYEARSASAMIAELTPREADILRLISGGMANKEIGVKLHLSEKTIKNYISRMFIKLNVTARTQAAVFAIKSGIA